MNQRWRRGCRFTRSVRFDRKHFVIFLLFSLVYGLQPEQIFAQPFSRIGKSLSKFSAASRPGGGAKSGPSPRFTASTAHFTVDAPDPVLAKKVAQEAERFRKELAIEWLGHEIAEWEEKCPINVELAMHAGGETSFAFVMDRGHQGRPTSWQMKIFGSPERLLDSVLPHEVTHTIFATHFGCPLPRWADEGACTIVEHESERRKNHQMLMDFLQSNRGIPFNRMYEMKQYPHDILPLYAQGHSLSRFLVLQKGKRHFLDYIAAGMNSEQQGPLLSGWNKVTQSYYGFKDLSDLQENWIAWVRAGSKEANPELIAANDKQNRANNVRQVADLQIEKPAPPTGDRPILDINAPSPVVPASFIQEDVSSEKSSSKSWYIRQAQGSRTAVNRETVPAESNKRSYAGSLEESNNVYLDRSDDARLRSEPGEDSTIWR